MVVIHKARMHRKVTGGRYRQYRGKRTYERGSLPIMTTTGSKDEVRRVRTKGAGSKAKVAITLTVNLYDPKEKKFYKAKTTSVSDNPANRHFVRQNIVTKGAIVVTEKGKAKITSRPGQDGTVNAVLIA